MSAAKRGGVTLVAVTLNAPDDWSDHKKLLDYGFNVCKSGLLICDLADVSVSVCGGKKSNVALRPAYEAQGISGSDCVLLLKPFEYAPVTEGDILGKAVFYSGGRVVAEIPVEAAESVQAHAVPVKKQEENSSFKKLFYKIKEFFVQR